MHTSFFSLVASLLLFYYELTCLVRRFDPYIWIERCGDETGQLRRLEVESNMQLDKVPHQAIGHTSWVPEFVPHKCLHNLTGSISKMD
jgi:hypothetical protein